MVELICTGCPMGCRIQIEQNDQTLNITGYGCKRGLDYAKEETVSPKRVLTGVVKLDGLNKVLPVKTTTTIPKDKISVAFAEIKTIVIKAPVKSGQVIKEDLAGTGVALVATKNSES